MSRIFGNYDEDRREEGAKKERVKIIRNLISMGCTDQFITELLNISQNELDDFKKS